MLLRKIVYSQSILKMEALKQFEVTISSLSEGMNTLEFEIKDSFFESFESSRIVKGDLSIQVELFRKLHQFEATIEIKGTINIPCDKCLSDYPELVDSSERLIFKLTEQNQEDDPMVVHVSPEAVSIHFADYFYEFIHVQLPVSSACEAYKEDKVGEYCDEEVLNKYFDLVEEAEETKEDDSEGNNDTWSALRDLNLN